MMQMKSALAVIMRANEVSPSPNSVYPIAFDTKTAITKAKDGVHLKMTRREKRT